ncbi:MAG: phosphatidylinositol mannoside acyltransferase [Acidimicrobiia bacterium]|nr:phosphatidylinositol mannoside acyltransferase [Acidimicrobiia bacterium]
MSDGHTVRDRLGYYVYRAFVGVLGLLPEPAMRAAGTGLGRLLWYLAPGRRRLVQRHLRRILGGDVDVTARSKAMFASYGRYWAEVFWLRPGRIAGLVSNSTVENVPGMRAAFAQGKGLLLILPHMGNWEVAGAVSKDLGMPVMSAAENLPNPLITDWFVKVRQMAGIDIVLTGRGARATGALMKRLQDGGTVALLADRDVTGRGIPVTFFGEETTMPAGPIALAVKTGAPVLVVGSYFENGAGHRYEVSDPLPMPDEGTKEEKVAAGVQLLAGALEERIRRKPEDWHLFVPNWPSDREEES